MANRYWLGGNWNDINNWSATNNGAGGASIPTSSDSVFWHTIPNSSTYTINAVASCLDMDWTGATNNPIIAGTSPLNIYGSLTLISTITFSHSGNKTMQSTTTGKTVTTAGILIGGSFIFGGVGGGWTLQDNLNANVNVLLNNGALATNGKAINCITFDSSNSNARTLTLGASIITVTSGFSITTVTNLTFNAGTSTIIVSGTTFSGGGLTYNIVNFTGATVTISGSSTFATLNQATGTTLKATSGTTQTITNPVFNGTLANPSTLQSVTAGSAATIALPAGRYFIRHTSTKDITITGATAVTSIAGSNVSGNTGITFISKFEIGRIKNDGSFNWYSAATGTVDKVSG